MRFFDKLFKKQMEPFIEIGEPLMRYKKPLPLTLTEEVIWLRSTVKESVEHCKDLLLRNESLSNEVHLLTEELNKVKVNLNAESQLQSYKDQVAKLKNLNKALFEQNKSEQSKKSNDKQIMSLMSEVSRLKETIKSKDKIINTIACGIQSR